MSTEYLGSWLLQKLGTVHSGAHMKSVLGCISHRDSGSVILGAWIPVCSAYSSPDCRDTQTFGAGSNFRDYLLRMSLFPWLRSAGEPTPAEGLIEARYWILAQLNLEPSSSFLLCDFRRWQDQDQIKDSSPHSPALQEHDPSTGEQTASFLQPQREEQFTP